MWQIPRMTSARRLDALAQLPAQHARQQLQQQARLQQRTLDLLRRPAAAGPETLLSVLRDGVAGLLALPFDLLRAQHAAGVLAGMLPHSLLESTRFERRLGALERLALGPLSRSA